MKELIEVAKQALEYIKENNIDKPHFVKHAKAVIKKAEKQNSLKSKAIDMASNYLSDGDLTTLQMIKAIAKHKDQKDLIDSVDGVVVWQKVEYSFTCEDFLQEIGWDLF